MEGTFKLPHSKSGAFSKANWGDCQVVSQQGVMTTVKRASVFLKKIRSLQDQQWKDIHKAAVSMGNNKGAKRVDSAECEDGSDSSGDDELFDPLYDKIPEPAD
jgi:hypothetical protein